MGVGPCLFFSLCVGKMILLLRDGGSALRPPPLVSLHIDIGWQHEQSADQRVLGELRGGSQIKDPRKQPHFPGNRGQQNLEPRNHAPHSRKDPYPAHLVEKSLTGRGSSVLMS